MKTVLYVAALSLAAAALAVSPTARAGTTLALDLDFATAIDEPHIDSGGGGALRLGYELDLAVLSLTPEIGGSYHALGGRIDVKHYAGFVGGRVSFGKVLEPGVFAHLGIGRLSADVGDASDTGPAFDAGVTLDFTLLPILDLGVHAAYANLIMDEGENFDWVRLGAHAALSF